MSRRPLRLHRVRVKDLPRNVLIQRMSRALQGHPETTIVRAARLLETNLVRHSVQSLVSKAESVASIARSRGLLIGNLSPVACGHLVGTLHDCGWTRDMIDGALSFIALLHDLAGLRDPTRSPETIRRLPPKKPIEDRGSARPLRYAEGLVSIQDMVDRPRLCRQDLVRATLAAVAYSTGFHKEALVRIAPASFHRLPEGIAIEMELQRGHGSKHYSAAINATAFALILKLAEDVGVAAPLTAVGDSDDRPIFRGLERNFEWKETHLSESYVEKHLKAAFRATARWKLETGALAHDEIEAAERSAMLTSARSPRRGLIKDLFDARVELLQIAAYLDCDVSEVCNCLKVARPIRGNGTW